MKRFILILPFFICAATAARAQQIRVTPSSVNAYSQGATTVYLTFTNVVNKRPVDACWCGDIIPADPDIGMKCNPATVFGCLPVRYDQSRLSRSSTYTDIMSIPPAVARRAYADAAGGAESTFFYVRRFVSTTGGPDEFVPVTIRLSGNGAAVSFSITDVRLTWGVNKPVLIVQPKEKLPRIEAEIKYTGTGRVKGRWELVRPGDELPTDFDLLSEASLPPEQRARQKRYSQLSRFNVYLPPTGKFVLSGPEAWRMPSHVDGLYLVLLRIEAAEDAQGNSVTGPGGVVATGGVAGFPLPVLRYYVGGDASAPEQTNASLTLLAPADNVTLINKPMVFSWSEMKEAAFHKIEIEDSAGAPVLSAVLLPGMTFYQAPSWLKDKLVDKKLRWRVLAFDRSGAQLAETPRRILQLGN